MGPIGLGDRPVTEVRFKMISIRCLFKRPFLLPTILLAFCSIGSSFEIAQAQSQTPRIKTDRALYPEPALPVLPASGGTFHDPVFGTEIMRATDASDGAAPGLGTYYSHWPTFNCDNTRILIRKGDSGAAIIKTFDPVNFRLGDGYVTLPYSLPIAGGPNWESATWSNTDPDIIYTFPNFYDGGMKLYTYNVSTRVFQLIKDFGFLGGSGDYLTQMYMSADNDTFCWLQHRSGHNGEPIGYIVYKRSTDTVLFHNPSNVFAGGINEVHVDKSGKWLWIIVPTIQADGTASRWLNLEDGTVQTQVPAVDHSPGHGDLGTGMVAGFDRWLNGVSYRKLENIHQWTEVFQFRTETGVSDWTQDFHGSMLADNENWMTIGTYDEPTTTLPDSGVFENEIMQIALDGSQRLRRICHTRSEFDGQTDTTGYLSNPKPTISKDGRFIAFTSNWENSGRYDLFIAKIDPASSTTPAPTPTPVPDPTATPTPNPSPVLDMIWVEDSLPANATPGTSGESWSWVSSSPSRYSGAVASQSSIAAGFHQHYFTGASATMKLDVGEILIAYVNIDPDNRPSQIMLQWRDTTGSWEHRAYWGANKIDFGTEGTSGRRFMGALPPSGEWVRLEVPASQVGLEGMTVSGMAFTQYDGRATWDHAGKATHSLPSPTPTPSPTPIDTPTPTPTPTPEPPPVSLGLVSSSSSLASGLAMSSFTGVEQIAPLVASIAEAHAVFLLEQNRFSSGSQIDRELRASLYFARGAEALAWMNSPHPGIQSRLKVVAYYLSRAKDTMSGGNGTSGTSASLSLVPNSLAGGALVIGPADALSSASFAPVLAPASLGTILGDPNQSPLSTQTTYATLSSSGELPYELNEVSVAIGGRAARLISVSPSRIYFAVPEDVPVGQAEVIVTSQEGYVSRGMTTIVELAPGIFTVNGYGMGDAVVLNAVTLMSGEFNVSTPENFGADKQTRLMIFASGISNGILNTNTSNDISFGVSIFPNLAESVVVEAHTVDNRTFQLPVEFVGPSGRRYGLDQINVRLTEELRGAGSVELTLIVQGQRSNMAMIKIR